MANSSRDNNEDARRSRGGGEGRACDVTTDLSCDREKAGENNRRNRKKNKKKV